jgi:hypothetical protein
MMLKSMYNLLPPPLVNLHLEAPPVSTVNCTSEVLKMVSSSTALTVAQVCSLDTDAG